MANQPVPAAPRLHCEATLSPGATVELSERAARHVAALRLRVGDAVILFGGDGHESAAVITGIGKRGVVAAVRERRAVDRESPLDVRLAQGVCAGDRMDLVLQKATELGVAAIQPILTARSSSGFERAPGASRDALAERGIAACEQCGRTASHASRRAELREFSGAPRRPGRRPACARREATVRSLAASASDRAHRPGRRATEERAIAIAAGFVTVRFGCAHSADETAPVAALAALQALRRLLRNARQLTSRRAEAARSSPRSARFDVERGCPSKSLAFGSTPRPTMKSCAAARRCASPRRELVFVVVDKADGSQVLASLDRRCVARRVSAAACRWLIAAMIGR
jgi:16S rRNA (uracil1498-N3)-methyltransferase